ncbi:hypothetical protein SAMN05421684_0133 [Asanoa ishikariensis]|uniref:Uncharacterized protein n=1 Tax=Asanoa ishikariensis TaxID=137265 RepID=A0A1H3KI17_9ACTN|nr:hypothetical protein SAMN05421684_0133 [Asanoa ishikariensis]
MGLVQLTNAPAQPAMAAVPSPPPFDEFFRHRYGQRWRAVRVPSRHASRAPRGLAGTHGCRHCRRSARAPRGQVPTLPGEARHAARLPGTGRWERHRRGPPVGNFPTLCIRSCRRPAWSGTSLRCLWRRPRPPPKPAMRPVPAVEARHAAHVCVEAATAVAHAVVRSGQHGAARRSRAREGGHGRPPSRNAARVGVEARHAAHVRVKGATAVAHAVVRSGQHGAARRSRAREGGHGRPPSRNAARVGVEARHAAHVRVKGATAVAHAVVRSGQHGAARRSRAREGGHGRPPSRRAARPTWSGTPLTSA